MLGGPGRGHGTERPERLGGEEPFAGRKVEQPVLELDSRVLLDRHQALGSSEPAPERGRRGVSVWRRPDASATSLRVSNVSCAPARAVDLLDPPPPGVGPEAPGPPVVGLHDPDDLGDPVAGVAVLDRHERLDPPIEVALHQVGRPDVPLLVAAVQEAVDARVLEELADDRADHDPVGDPLAAGPDRADAADDEVHVDAALARPVRAPGRRPGPRSR